MIKIRGGGGEGMGENNTIFSFDFETYGMAKKLQGHQQQVTAVRYLIILLLFLKTHKQIILTSFFLFNE